MTLAAPLVIINGTLQQSQRTIPPPGIPNAMVAGQPPIASVAQRSTGALLWLYLPGRGRYILSLVPRPELDFKVAGEFRGGKAEFTVGTDLISLECNNEIAPGQGQHVVNGAGLGNVYKVPLGTNGLMLDTQTGQITGTPITIGGMPLTVTATDGSGITSSQTYTLSINPQPPDRG